MMSQSMTMSVQFETEKNRKAFLYSSLIMGGLLLIAIFIKWQLYAAVKPVAQDFIEINLGNFEEGMGETQPLIKGEKAPSDMPSQPEPTKASAPQVQEEKEPENDDPEAAPVTKTVKEVVPKVTKPAPVVAPPAPKPQKPKIAAMMVPRPVPAMALRKTMAINTRATIPTVVVTRVTQMVNPTVMAILPVEKLAVAD